MGEEVEEGFTLKRLNKWMNIFVSLNAHQKENNLQATTCFASFSFSISIFFGCLALLPIAVSTFSRLLCARIRDINRNIYETVVCAVRFFVVGCRSLFISFDQLYSYRSQPEPLPSHLWICSYLICIALLNEFQRRMAQPSGRACWRGKHKESNRNLPDTDDDSFFPFCIEIYCFIEFTNYLIASELNIFEAIEFENLLANPSQRSRPPAVQF